MRVANDASPLGGESPVDVASTTGSPQRVGSFRFYFDDERWDWSPEVERMHGYQPGAAHPTTSLVLSHKHPDDYADIAATLEASGGRASLSAPGTASSTFRAALTKLS